jgi:methylglutaconyl-CoA hydratase
MADHETITVSTDGRGIAVVTLNRPEVRNAMNARVIAEVGQAFTALGADPGVRAIVVRGAGKVFCAGADLNWMRDVEDQTADEIAGDSRRLEAMFRAVDECPKTVIARVHGAAMAGALGIVACSDIAIAEEGTKFCVSEVRLGLTPGIISTFVMPKVGASRMRYWSVSAVVFEGAEALRAGLVHRLADGEDELDRMVDEQIDLALTASPDAVAWSKQLLAEVGGAGDPAAFDRGLAWNLRARTSDVAKAGIGAFLEKRPPPWSAAAD